MGTETWLSEPEFHRDDFLSLHPPSFLQEQAYDYLTRQVSHQPNILSYHVCRIQVAITQGEEAVYAALIDLIWVLGNKGRPLQKRLILAARKWLSHEKYELLSNHLTGRLSLRSLPFSCRCVIHDGAWGDVEWRPGNQPQEPGDVDWVQAAQDCLGMGQIDQAREMLESQLAQTPGHLQAAQTLLEIYKATKDTAMFLRVYKRLETHGSLDSDWQEAFNELTGEGGLDSR